MFLMTTWTSPFTGLFKVENTLNIDVTKYVCFGEEVTLCRRVLHLSLIHISSCFVAGRVTRAGGGTVASVCGYTQLQSSKNFVELNSLLAFRDNNCVLLLGSKLFLDTGLLHNENNVAHIIRFHHVLYKPARK